MPQTVQNETQAEQQGLPHLHGQSAARSAGRELALDRREDTLDQSAAAVESLPKCPPHFGAHTVDARGFLSALGRDHAPRTEFSADVGVISLAVEFSVGQHQPDACSARSSFHNRWQVRAVVPRTAPGALRQQKLLVQIGGDDPLQPMSPGQRLLPVVMQSSHEERADRALRQTRRVHADTGSSLAFPGSAPQAAHGFADRPIDGLVVQAFQKAIQSREIGHARQSERLTQFAMFAQPNFGFAKGPVFLAHQTKDRQELRLCELVFAETAAEARKHRPANLQGDASKRQESDFGHRTSCLGRKQQFSRTCDCEFSYL
jgi:hypothetical protein